MPSIDSWKRRFGRLKQRMIGRRASGASRREHQQARELRGDLTQVFEMRPSGEDVGNGEVVERVVHGNGLYKQKG